MNTACMLLLAAAVNAPPNLSVAILDYQDTWNTTKGLGQLLDDLSQPHTDLTAATLAGNPIALTGFNTFIIGGFCTQNETIRAALTAAGPTMHQFVADGGTVIMLTQADQNRAAEDWIESPATVTRGDSDFDNVYRVQPKHQVFNRPETIDDAHLQGWRYQGSSTWPTSWESFGTFRAVGVLAGDNATIVNLASIIETGWGDGRVLFLSLAPDKARNIGNAQARAQAPRLMSNLLQYARDVMAGTVDPIIIYQGGGFPDPINGVVYNDLNGDGVRDPGEPGIANVGVSDTFDIVLTGPQGAYTLPNPAGDAALIFVSIPAGFAKDAVWYRHIGASSGGADFEFALTASDESGPFEFVQVTDIHVGAAGNKQLLTDALDRIADLTNPPELVLATGDLVNTGSNRFEYDDYVAAISTSRVPYFSVFGNHDANNGGSANYRTYLGPDYYSFNYGDCHFLIVNSVHDTPQERLWIERDLALLRGNRRLFIFQHYSPSETEHNDYATRGAKAVFTGHWHSQHTVRVGEMGSYNTANLLFGGIDCSPAGFKVVSVTPNEVTTRMRWLADGRRLQIVWPTGERVFTAASVPIVVNAYDTSSEITAVRYELYRGGAMLDAGALAKEGDWSWVAALSALPAKGGAQVYTLNVTAYDDKGRATAAQSRFRLTTERPPAPPMTAQWRQFGGGPQRGSRAAAALQPPLSLVWVADTGAYIDFGSPVLSNLALYIGVKDRRDFARNGVLALNVTDGRQLWFSPTPAAVSHSVALDDENVYACSHGGILHAFERISGNELWRRVLGSDVQRWQYAAPVIFGSRVYAGTFAYFGAYNVANGAEHWNNSYGGDWISSNASPATDGTRVIVPANWSSNSLRAVSAVNGATLWQYNVRGLHGSPVIAGDKVLCTDWSGFLHAVRLSNGTRVWRQDLGGGRSASTPAVSGNIVVAGGTGRIRAFRLDNGAPLWETPVASSPLKMAPYDNTFAALVGSPTIAGPVAYVPAGDGRLYALDLPTGRVLWSLNFGVPILSAPCIAGQYLFLATYDGHVYALAGTSLEDADDK